jgi:hypothetical protein
MLSPKIIEFAPKKFWIFALKKRLNGLGSINSGSEQAQMDELTDAMGVRIDSTWSIFYHWKQGNCLGNSSEYCKIGELQHQQRGAWQMRPPNHPHKGDCLGLPAGLDGTVNSLTFFKNISYLNCWWLDRSCQFSCRASSLAKCSFCK